MRALYFFRVLLVSLEALLIAIAGLVWYHFSSDLNQLAATISLNDEMLKYLMVVPGGLLTRQSNRFC